MKEKELENADFGLVDDYDDFDDFSDEPDFQTETLNVKENLEADEEIIEEDEERPGFFSRLFLKQMDDMEDEEAPVEAEQKRAKRNTEEKLSDERRERRHKRQKRERAFKIFAIILIVLMAALFALYFMQDKIDLFNKQENDNVNLYPIGEETAMPTEEPTPTEAVAAERIGLPPASWANSNDLLDMIMEGGGNHAVYLTFDDGPNDVITPQVLDILAQYGVKATFFEVGKNIEAYPEIAQRVADEGHCIAGHSYSHDYDALYATEESFINEVDTTYAIIAGLYPEDQPPMKLIRFPGGSYNAGDHAAEKQVYKETLKAMDFYYADWNCLTGDAEGEKKDAEGLFNYFTASIATNNLVVLMHDAATKQDTVYALPQIIEYLIAQGYEFRTLDNIVYNPAPAEEPAAADAVVPLEEEYPADAGYEAVPEDGAEEWTAE